jgi:hypothetical protein
VWIELLTSYFPATVRERAAEYVHRVRVREADGRTLHAHVTGSDEYCIRVQREGAALAAACSCPYFEDGGPCKHLWAVLVHASRKQMFAASPTIVELRELDVHDDDLRPAPGRSMMKPQPAWRQALTDLRNRAGRRERVLEPGAELIYILDVPATAASDGVVVEVALRTRKRDGEWAKPRALTLAMSAAAQLPDPADREILPLVAAVGGDRHYYSTGYSDGYGFDSRLPKRSALPVAAAVPLVARMAATGRLSLRGVEASDDLVPCAWLEGAPYRLRLRVRPSDDGKELILSAQLEREGATRDLRERLLLIAGGVVFFRDHAAPIDLPRGAYEWVRMLGERGGELRVPAKDGPALVDELHLVPEAPAIDLPAELRFDERRVPPQPWLLLRTPPRSAYSDKLVAELRFDYDGCVVTTDDPRQRIKQGDARVVYVRDRDAERAAEARLPALGFRRERPIPEPEMVWVLPPKALGGAVRALTAEGWRVEADGKLFRAPGTIEVDVVSGIDWFDLEAEVAYGANLRASLPALLKAQRRDGYVRLDDGSYGLLPEEWLARHRLVGDLGSVAGDAIRFTRSQIGLLDALLAAMPEARGDAELERARAALARFSGVRAQDAPQGFVGSLRGYQREGLGWLEFLREFGFGGCLADDMGLGKTVQVLAMLASRRGSGKPSIAVVPKSLMFNWRREAARFVPELRVVEHHGSSRVLDEIDGHDLVVTTYGTLVRDIAELRNVDFDYAILDEGQAIKNPRTETARAVRLLRADHRLVLTGTPVENRLADLWSLFEFLNPGMLGGSDAFKQLGGREVADDGSRALLARALRPFILRRTKEQVARDLPAKNEHVIYCELEGAERKRYDELRAYYRATLLGLIDDKGIESAQMHILEALLRLRQAACHPGLIDREQAGEKSAKLTALLEQLDEVVAGGHKALVFSQFTTLLGIVKRHLDEANIRYEYLDGRTRDRQAKVDRFQSDPDCPLFLISLKAGGVGLNLTAAEYVFLLDPWWNPAVESQAIDRTHRIGQSRAVFAYRLIGRDTIEEKVLALQAQKRHLADAIITADNSLLASIGREELEILLS